MVTGQRVGRNRYIICGSIANLNRRSGEVHRSCPGIHGSLQFNLAVGSGRGYVVSNIYTGLIKGELASRRNIVGRNAGRGTAITNLGLNGIQLDIIARYINATSQLHGSSCFRSINGQLTIHLATIGKAYRRRRQIYRAT